MRKQLTTNVLFVCTGNTCRSPMAEAIARHVLRESGADGRVSVSSAGVSAGQGHPASPETLPALQKLGIETADHRSRALTRELIEWADVIFTMTSAHAHAVRTLAPDAARQILLRNLAGLIVIDFREDETAQRRQAGDRGLAARIEGAWWSWQGRSRRRRFGRCVGMTAAGLIEVTRQRSGPSLTEELLAPQAAERPLSLDSQACGLAAAGDPPDRGAGGRRFTAETVAGDDPVPVQAGAGRNGRPARPVLGPCRARRARAGNGDGDAAMTGKGKNGSKKLVGQPPANDTGCRMKSPARSAAARRRRNTGLFVPSAAPMWTSTAGLGDSTGFRPTNRPMGRSRRRTRKVCPDGAEA